MEKRALSTTVLSTGVISQILAEVLDKYFQSKGLGLDLTVDQWETAIAIVSSVPIALGLEITRQLIVKGTAKIGVDLSKVLGQP